MNIEILHQQQQQLLQQQRQQQQKEGDEERDNADSKEAVECIQFSCGDGSNYNNNDNNANTNEGHGSDIHEYSTSNTIGAFLERASLTLTRERGTEEENSAHTSNSLRASDIRGRVRDYGASEGNSDSPPP